MRVRLRFFAALRETLGSEAVIDLPAGPYSVAQVRDELIARGGAWAQALGRDRPIRAALDQLVCPESALVTDNAEVAFFPPVTGG